MKRTPPQTSRSPTLRVLAWLAWLVLAASPVVGMPVEMLDGAPPVAHGTAQVHTMGHGQATSASVDDCCHEPLLLTGQHADPDCRCAGVCCSALPVMALAPLTPFALADRPVSRLAGSAPAFVRAPPLRPPLA